MQMTILKVSGLYMFSPIQNSQSLLSKYALCIILEVWITKSMLVPYIWIVLFVYFLILPSHLIEFIQEGPLLSLL